jgi:hypothetical protein
MQWETLQNNWLVVLSLRVQIQLLLAEGENEGGKIASTSKRQWHRWLNNQLVILNLRV